MPPEPASNISFRSDLLDLISAKASQPAARVAIVGLDGGYGNEAKVWWSEQD